MENFDFNVRVYYDSTDAGGVVYHSRYLDFCERARTEFLRSRGIIQSKLLAESGIGFVVKNANLEFKKSAKLDDLLQISTKIIENNGIIIKMSQEIYLISREGIDIQKDLLFEMSVNLVCINKNFRPTRIPKDIVEKLR